MKTLLENALSLFSDADFYLRQISASAYSMPLPVLSGATIGQHTRHYIEFFQCLAETVDIEQPAKDLVVDYDQRRRDKNIENNPRYALGVVLALAEQLPKLHCDSNLWLAYTDYVSQSTVKLPTSLERELCYNIEHTIHHFALIKIGLCVVSPCLQVPPHFGVAPSTLYRSPDFSKRGPTGPTQLPAAPPKKLPEASSGQRLNGTH